MLATMVPICIMLESDCCCFATRPESMVKIWCSAGETGGGAPLGGGGIPAICGLTGGGTKDGGAPETIPSVG